MRTVARPWEPRQSRGRRCHGYGGGPLQMEEGTCRRCQAEEPVRHAPPC